MESPLTENTNVVLSALMLKNRDKHVPLLHVALPEECPTFQILTTPFHASSGLLFSTVSDPWVTYNRPLLSHFSSLFTYPTNFFGSSKYGKSQSMCPELVVGLQYGTKIDVNATYVPWILGVESVSKRRSSNNMERTRDARKIV